MESHPVPQNVTSFEFHLVGDMTLKQFIYLAIGLATAYLIFVFFAQPFPFVAWPLIALCAGIGVAFAFLPLQERPLDHWVIAFFKAIFQPTQRTYQSDKIKDPASFQNRLNLYLSQIHLPAEEPTPKTPVLTKPLTPPQVPIHQMRTPAPPPPKPAPLPSAQDLSKTVTLAKQAQNIQNEIVTAEGKLSQIKTSAAGQGVDPKMFTKQFQNVLSNLQELNEEASGISKELAELSKTSSPSITSAKKAKSIPSVNLTSIPNVINGVVTDSLGNYLEGAIVVAHDKQGIPVRALKTNKLGQFIAATPLPNGVYNISVEKDDLQFDVNQVELVSKVLNPIMVIGQRRAI